MNRKGYQIYDETGFYKDRLSDRGIEVIIPDDVDVGCCKQDRI